MMKLNLLRQAAALPAELTRDEARVLTNRINAAAEELWRLLLESHERQAWKALGYGSWRAYAKAEIKIGKSHAYRLLHQGQIIRRLAAAAGVSPTGEIISERAAREMTPKTETAIAASIRNKIAAGEMPEAAINSAVAEARAQVIDSYVKAGKRPGQSSRIIENIALAVADLRGATKGINFEEIDTGCIPRWLSDLRLGVTTLRSLSRKLEQVAEGAHETGRPSRAAVQGKGETAKRCNDRATAAAIEGAQPSVLRSLPRRDSAKVIAKAVASIKGIVSILAAIDPVGLGDDPQTETWRSELFEAATFFRHFGRQLKPTTRDWAA